uniref:Uncharacterized protein n=1 Tax=Amphimedon queenslandica TaxID=400682 RepID=A0A1X7VTU3_AMPQE
MFSGFHLILCNISFLYFFCAFGPPSTTTRLTFGYTNTHPVK